MESLNPTEVLEFINLVSALKHLPRRGWERCGIENPEPIAGHMYAMGMMTFLLGNDSNLDRLKCLQLTLVHDLAECIVGDIIPHDNIEEEVKHQMEDTAMKKIVSYLGDSIGGLVYSLYKEYEAKETPEAKFVKDLDRFDMVFTASLYEKRDGCPGKLQEFFDHAKEKIENPFVNNLFNELTRLRNKRINM